MDIRIGITDVPREITFESDESPEAIEQAVIASLDAQHLALTDSKGKRFIVPSRALAYVEIGTDQQRQVGFVV